MQSKKLSRDIRKRRFTKAVNLADKTVITAYKSNKNLLIQVNDPKTYKTLFAYSTSKIKDKATKTEKSKLLAKPVADFIAEKKLTNLVFNRNGYLYHGRIKSLAEGAREGGLQF